MCTICACVSKHAWSVRTVTDQICHFLGVGSISHRGCVRVRVLSLLDEGKGASCVCVPGFANSWRHLTVCNVCMFAVCIVIRR